MKDLTEMGRDYAGSAAPTMTRTTDPFMLFEEWLTQACETKEIREPSAMSLATVDERQSPATRMVLLKGVEQEKFIFYTNYQSAKGRHLLANPQAALLFWWEALARQVRIVGRAQQLDAVTANRYFAIRPRGSQLVAWVSPQSQTIKSHEELTQRLMQLEGDFANKPVPRPPHWGGFAIEPDSMEFWQGGPDRLHRRVLYSRGEQGWRRRYLAP